MDDPPEEARPSQRRRLLGDGADEGGGRVGADEDDDSAVEDDASRDAEEDATDEDSEETSDDDDDDGRRGFSNWFIRRMDDDDDDDSAVVDEDSSDEDKDTTDQDGEEASDDDEDERSGRRGILNRFLAELGQGSPSVEALLFLVREYGGDGDILWADEYYYAGPETTYRHINSPFGKCISGLAQNVLLDFLRRLFSEYPGLSSKQRGGGCTLLYLAMVSKTVVPLEVSRCLVRENPGALKVPDAEGRLPIHLASSSGFWCRRRPLDVATVRLLATTDPATLQVKDSQGKLPLHCACERLGAVADGDLPAMAAIELMIELHPEALEVRDSEDKSPLTTAIRACGETSCGRLNRLRRQPKQIQFLQWMIQRGGRAALRHTYTDSDGRVATYNDALKWACFWWPNTALFTSLIELDPAGPSARDFSGAVPLHSAISGWEFWNGGPDVQDALQLLVDKYPAALAAKEKEGTTAVMDAIVMAAEYPEFEPTPESLECIKAFIRRAPESIRGTYICTIAYRFPHSCVSTTALELACTKDPLTELVSSVLEAWPIALCVSLTGDLTRLHEALPGKHLDLKKFREDLQPTLQAEARSMFLALVDVLLHDTTRGCVPDPVRDHVRHVSGMLVPPHLLDGGGIEATQAIRILVPEHAFHRLRSDVLTNERVQQFLQSHEPIQDMVTGVYRMNKAGRSGGSDAFGDAAVDAPRSADLHLRVLESAADDLSCVFLHLRDCCGSLFGRGDGKAAAGAAAASPGPIRADEAEAE